MSYTSRFTDVRSWASVCRPLPNRDGDTEPDEDGKAEHRHVVVVPRLQRSAATSMLID
jgi:hypothetical protein